MTSPNGHIALVVHDTIASPRSSFASVVRYCKTKWSKPCYNEMIGRQGEREKLTFKTSYNAGRINADAYNRLVNRQPIKRKPGKDSTITRNSTLWGIAFNRAAREPISPAQWNKMVGVLAWRCEHWNIDPHTQIIAHKELTRRKNDPWDFGSVNVISKLRKDVARKMKKNNAKVKAERDLAICSTCGQRIGSHSSS